MFAGGVYTLAKYGHVYLSEEEYQQRFHAKLAEYYAQLAAAALDFRGRRYWQFHRTMLSRIGTPLDRARLTKAIAWHVARRAIPGSLARGAKRTLRMLRNADSRKS
jgi:hypothetical protein